MPEGREPSRIKSQMDDGLNSGWFLHLAQFAASVPLGTIAHTDLDCPKRNDKSVRSFLLSIRKHFEHWHKLPRKLEESPTLEILNSCQHGPGQPSGQDDLQRSLLTSAVLQFCYFAFLAQVLRSTLGLAREISGKENTASACFCVFCLGLVSGKRWNYVFI